MSASFSRGLTALLTIAVGMAFSANTAVAQQDLRISIQNNQTAGGFYLTPLWFGIHNGGFDTFNLGDAASSAIEAIAEGGDVSGLNADFAAAQPSGQQGVILSPGGFAGAPVIDPGEFAFTEITLTDPSLNRYFSYASMVIPTNDAFIGNGDQMAHELFDAAGNFNGPVTIQIFGGQVWDAGTEANDGLGAAFSANGGMSTDENLLIRVHPGLDNFVGTTTAAGTQITSGLGGGELLATIRVSSVPEPGSLTLLGLASAFIAIRRRRRA